MLGIPDEEAESSTEEAILAGSLDSASIEFAEDELIDDYLFARLSPEEEQRFRGHFLRTDDRRGRLAIAQAIKQYAGEQPVNAFEVREISPHWKFRTRRFSWITATAAAVSCVLAVMLGLQFLHSQREAEVARNAESEVERLRTALVAQNQKAADSAASTGIAPPSPEQQNYPSHPTGPAPDLVLAPGQTRGPGSRKDIQFSLSKRLIVIDLVLPAVSGEWYREELVTSDGTPLLIQEIPIHGTQPESRSTIALSAAKLPPGDYQIRLLVASSDHRFQEYDNYGFRVKRP
jgi:hypothetical protein